jgi:hypothetical protein
LQFWTVSVFVVEFQGKLGVYHYTGVAQT